MKKTLLLAAAAVASLAANAETFTYDFNQTPAYCNVIASPEGPTGGGNYDFIDKYGTAVNTSGEAFINRPAEGEKGIPTDNRLVSLYDGKTYTFLPDEEAEAEWEDALITDDVKANAFISWGPKGITRTLLMTGWGSEDAWADKDYNGATADDWVATKNGISFLRLGTLDMVSRTDTYIQFPAVTGNVTVTVWAGAASDSSSKNQDLNVLVTPVFDGAVDTEKAVNIVKESGSFVEKRMYKLDPITFDATGKNLAVRVGCNGNILHIYHVVIEGERGEYVTPEDARFNEESGVAAVIADQNDANAPVYNVLGQRVNENYKGLVIKNGKKYVQK